MQTYLDRIKSHDPQIHAFVHLDEQAAARAPIGSMAIAIKANIAVRGMPWHAGIAAHRGRIAPQDAACVARLRAQGVIILGLVNMHEAAFGGTTDNPTFGRTENPHRPGFTAGGSSGGSAAAVAAGFCAASLGTDTLGSVRIPSGYCGVVGHKPAAGTLDLAGIVPLSPTLDQLGFHAPDVATCASLFEILTGQPPCPAPRPGRLALLHVEDQVELQPAPLAALAEAAERAKEAGWTVEPLRLTGLDYGKMRRLALLIAEIEGERIHRADIAATPEGFSPGLRRMFAWAAEQAATREQPARQALADIADQIRAAFRPYDAILAPTTPQCAFAWDQPVPANQADITTLASITGLPAVALPAGVADGLPCSVQIMAGTDAGVLGVAGMLERKKDLLF